jgi:hypothetical protein
MSKAGKDMQADPLAVRSVVASVFCPLEEHIVITCVNSVLAKVQRIQHFLVTRAEAFIVGCHSRRSDSNFLFRLSRFWVVVDAQVIRRINNCETYETTSTRGP